MPKLKSKVWNGVISAVFAIAVAVLILTFSIGLPIYFRPFYYMQIDADEIRDMVMLYSKHFDLGYIESDITEQTIRDAFDEVMDFLTLGKEFGTGIFDYSESGKSHFEDCKILFDLNAAALIISALTVGAVLILEKKRVIRLARPFGFNMIFIASVGMLATFAVIGAAAAINFDAAFTVFHKILFPGKSNWYFDPCYDGIIFILTEEFFMACGLLILVSIVLLTTAAITYGVIDRKRRGSSDTAQSTENTEQTAEANDRADQFT